MTWVKDADHGWWRYWHVTQDGSTRRSLRLTVWRVSAEVTLHVHGSHIGNRLVLQSSWRYDCKRWGRS